MPIAIIGRCTADNQRDEDDTRDVTSESSDERRLLSLVRDRFYSRLPSLRKYEWKKKNKRCSRGWLPARIGRIDVSRSEPSLTPNGVFL